MLSLNYVLNCWSAQTILPKRHLSMYGDTTCWPTSGLHWDSTVLNLPQLTNNNIVLRHYCTPIGILLYCIVMNGGSLLSSSFLLGYLVDYTFNPPHPLFSCVVHYPVAKKKLDQGLQIAASDKFVKRVNVGWGEERKKERMMTGSHTTASLFFCQKNQPPNVNLGVTASSKCGVFPEEEVKVGKLHGFSIYLLENEIDFFIVRNVRKNFFFHCFFFFLNLLLWPKKCQKD